MKCIFVELSPFSKKLKATKVTTLLKNIQDEILNHPEKGAPVPGLSGIKKIRVGRDGKGKRGSYRVFYLELCSGKIIHLIYFLSKNEAEDISADEKKAIRKIVLELKKERCT